MGRLHWLTTICIMLVTIQAQAQSPELQPLASCAVKVFTEINRTDAWSGKKPAGCLADLYVEKRPDGIYVTAWYSSASDQGWARVSLAVAMNFSEVADKKALKKGTHDLKARTARIERCLNSIIRVNDPLECRDSGTKTYSAGEELGTGYRRAVWLDDTGRHVVAEHAYGDSQISVSPPADLFGGPPLPPGTNLDIHIFDTD